MCSIAGVLNMRTDQATVENMLRSMCHRGPDSSGTYIGEGVCLLHSRLAIIDIQCGAQPMYCQMGPERYVIVYNGELYNTEEICCELKKMGHSFYGHSDTEVVLHAYIQWKEKMLNKLNGIFAFAVWEEHSNRLFLARDRMGVKPLFYSELSNKLVFSSEIKTILKHPDMDAYLDENGIAEILLLGPGRISGSGVFAGINELKPGHYGYWEQGRLQVKRYWKLMDREHTDTFEETVEMVRYLVTDSIRRQMVSDVPIGTFLSGGLDSSLISAICAEEMRERGQELNTFSVDYKDNEKYFVPGKFQPNSDRVYIDLMQKYIGSKHHNTVLNPQQLADALSPAVFARDLPGMADVDASLLLFCKEIKQKVKVALSGECADEIFGGYPWFRDPEVRWADGFPWSQNVLDRVALLPGSVKIDPIAFVNDLYQQTLREADVLPGTTALERRMKEMVVLNQNWFMQTLLDRKDRMSMYCGLEVRVPFCDYRIAEYLYGVPWEYKNYQNREKGLLRYASAGILPDKILWRKKSPYPKTHDPNYLKIVSARLEDVLNDPDARIHQIMNTEALRKLVNQDGRWPWYGQLMRTPQTIAFALQINEWLTHYNIRLK